MTNKLDEPSIDPSIDPSLNLNLGLGGTKLSSSTAFKLLRKSFILPSTIFTYTLEPLIFTSWAVIPLSIRAFLSRSAWSLYLPLHRVLIGKRTALHPSVSDEYAALTTVMWGARLFPMTLKRMRFGLSQICCNFPPTSSYEKEDISDPDTGVSGIYVHSAPKECKSKKVVFWIYGGAFLSGDCPGNVGLAESVAAPLESDVFIVNYRLCPESSINDALKDVVAGYKWLISSGRVRSGVDVQVLGISSGGGLAVRLCQVLAADKGFPKENMPGAQVLICPWVHYDWHSLYPSMINNNVHDLVVTQSVYEYVNRKEVILAMVGGESQRLKVSPLGKSMSGLPRTLTVCSKHEVTCDEDTALHEKMRKEGVEAKILQREYMCHVWCLVPMLPEAKETMDEVREWMAETWEGKE